MVPINGLALLVMMGTTTVACILAYRAGKQSR